jgi:hypothetical protein
MISQIQVELFSFSQPLIKLKLGLQRGGRLIIATHLDQSKDLANQHQDQTFASMGVA